MRLAKYLAHSGVSSRRAADEIIRSGRVTIGGDVVIDPARDVDDSSEVTLDGKPLSLLADSEVWAVNKPAGVVSTASDTHGRPTVVSLVQSPRRLYPVGRLDADTTGLILLTDDGELANRLTHPSFEVPKTYVASVDGGSLTPAELRRLREGIELDDGVTAPAKVRQLGAGRLELTIHEGRKRQIKRMCEAVGHPVTELRRVAFGPLRLDRLPPGQARKLTPAEVQRLRNLGAA